MAHTTSSTATTDAGGTGTTTTRTPHDTVNLSSKKDDILAEPLVAVPSAEGQKVSDEEFIKRIVNKAVQDIIQDEEYSHEATSLWTNKIVELLVRSFVNMDRDNKYIVTCMIVQNLRQGMRSATSCFWNAQTDSGFSLTNERNGMYVITTVFICKA